MYWVAGKDLRPRQLAQGLAGDRVDDRQALDRVAEHLDAKHRLLVRRVHLDGVAAHPEPAAAEHGVVAVELQVDEPAEDAAHVVVDADAEVDHAAAVLLGAAHAVDAAHRRDDDDVPPGQQRRRRGVAQAIDLVVDRGVLLDVGVARRDVRLGLVVVVVADEVLDPVLGEELPHLLGELGGEALVRRQDQGRLLHLLDRPGDGGRLAGPGDPEQGLEAVPALDALAQRGDRGGLVARRGEGRDDPERPGRGNDLGERRLGHASHSSGANNRSVVRFRPDPADSNDRSTNPRSPALRTCRGDPTPAPGGHLERTEHEWFAFALSTRPCRRCGRRRPPRPRAG